MAGVKSVIYSGGILEALGGLQGFGRRGGQEQRDQWARNGAGGRGGGVGGFSCLMIWHVLSYGQNGAYTGRGRGVWGKEENAVGISLGRYNICIGGNRGIDSALCAMAHTNMYIRVMFETKTMGVVYTRRSSDYRHVL